MERPNLASIKDKKVLAYIEYLEKQVENNLVQTINKFNRGMQRQFDSLADDMLADGTKLTLSDDKGIDRWLKIVKDYSPIITAMKEFEQRASPKEIKKDAKAITKDDGVEEFIAPK